MKLRDLAHESAAAAAIERTGDIMHPAEGDVIEVKDGRLTVPD